MKLWHDTTLAENAELKAQLALLQQQLTANTVLLQNQQTLIEQLQYQLRLQRLARFGRKSEKSPDQMGLFDEALVTPEQITEIQQADASLAKPRAQRQPSGRRALPAKFPRERIIHELAAAEQQCACGHALHKIGEDVSEQLEIIPVQVKVLQHVRYKYGCRRCEAGIKAAPLPKQPIPKSIASPGLLAHILTSKYADHLPLYRQEQILRRYGVEVSRGTLCHWTLACGELLAPLLELQRECLLADDYLCADETPVQVLVEKGQAKQSQGYMWVYMSGRPTDRLVLYDYQPSRAGAHATTLLENYQGYLQTDGYSGYYTLQAKTAITPLGCWAHSRRKFMEIVKTTKQPGKAQEAVQIIKALYQVEQEAQARQLSTEAVKALREAKAKPILISFKQWLIDTLPTTPPSGPLAKAIQYTLNQWSALQTYLQHGMLMIDNNAIENCIRPFALGRRNWLFMGNERGAKAAANIYSVLITAKVNGIDPYQYLKYLLETLPTCQTQDTRRPLLIPYCKSLFQPTEVKQAA